MQNNLLRVAEDQNKMSRQNIIGVFHGQSRDTDPRRRDTGTKFVNAVHLFRHLLDRQQPYRRSVRLKMAGLHATLREWHSRRQWIPAGETVPGLSRVGRRPLHFFDVSGPRNKELDYRPIKEPLKTIALPYASPTTLATTDTRVIPLITPTIAAVNTILNELLPSRNCPGPLRLWVTDLPLSESIGVSRISGYTLSTYCAHVTLANNDIDR